MREGDETRICKPSDSDVFRFAARCEAEASNGDSPVHGDRPPPPSSRIGPDHVSSLGSDFGRLQEEPTSPDGQEAWNQLSAERLKGTEKADSNERPGVNRQTPETQLNWTHEDGTTYHRIIADICQDKLHNPAGGVHVDVEEWVPILDSNDELKRMGRIDTVLEVTEEDGKVRRSVLDWKTHDMTNWSQSKARSEGT